MTAEDAAQMEHHLDARSLRTIPSAIDLSQLRLEALVNYTAEELRALSAGELANSTLFQASAQALRLGALADEQLMLLALCTARLP